MPGSNARLRDNYHVAQEVEQQQQRRKHTLMVCDDEADILNAISIFFEKRFNVITTTSGSECIRMYSKTAKQGGQIDVLLLDYKLQDTTGDEVARQIVNSEGSGARKTKILLITAYDLTDAKLANLRKEGVIHDCFRKPFGLKELESALSKTINYN